MVNQWFLKFLCLFIQTRLSSILFSMISIQDTPCIRVHFFEPAYPTAKYFLLFPLRMFKMTIDATWDLTKSVTWQIFHFCDKVVIKTYSIAYMFFLKTRLLHLFDTTWYGVKQFLYPSLQSVTLQREIYWALGDQKWKEYVDGQYHQYGRNVFATAAHGGSQELGYVDSQERAAIYVSDTLGQKLTPRMYLRIHSLVAGHFTGDDNNVCMSANNVGVFRRDYTSIQFNCGPISPEGLSEIATIEPSLFIMEESTSGEYTFLYTERTSEDVEQIFNQFTNDYYREIAQASTDDEKLQAIAWFYKKIELLHPVWDGSGRTDYAVLQKLLVENGFTPTIMHDPNKDPTRLPINELVQKIKEGFANRRNLLM